ncbi:NACHT domain-containing protein [Anabaena subtropica]|uniref:NACHT domain-containing protein n=1 Tax=Anabaena subtropica FACHB-260 TaxID=2692884 RepID=A0ABR8CXA0_9NOST|nr:NACHT domain-containing protein [Anabaena subtropica]MBD2347028.1 NACHT domain-containing protein [Anabaena subtropica FACHB-260]
MNKLLKNQLLLFIFGATATSLIGYLINQLPSIPDFRHKNLLIIGAVILVTLLIAWGTYQQSQQQPGDAPAQIDPTLRPRLLEAEATKVKKRLNDSLLFSLMIELDQQEQPEKVGRNPLQPLYTIATNQHTSPPQQINRLVEVLQRPDISSRLLILGQPGGGKTTTLLNLAEELLETAKQNDQAPMPLIFELSAWRDDSVNILDWLIIQLKEEYNLAPGISRFWLERGDILPLLDGLDELGLERQKKCIKAINQYLSEDAKRDLVVCCREEEYIAGEEQLTQLHGAICLQPLSDRQIQDYVNDLRRLHVWQEIQRNPEFLELARTPLLLSMMVVAYQGRAIQTKQDLFDAYIERRFNLLPVGKGEPPRKKILHFLVFLAKRLRGTQTEFLIENMQPSWLQNRLKIGLYPIFFILISGLMGLLFGLFMGLLFGVTMSIFMFLDEDEIELVEPVHLSVKRLGIKTTFNNIIYSGMFFGMFLGLFGLLVNGLIGLLIGWVIGALIFAPFSLIYRLESQLKTKPRPNQGIWASLKNALLLTVIVNIFFFSNQIWLKSFLLNFLQPADVNGIVFVSQTFTSAAAFFLGGGLACIQHFCLRFVLWRSGCIPWNYAQFLNHAAQRRLIQQVGGRYRFIHRLLLDHFANMPLS